MKLKELKNKAFIIANKHSFLFRFCNTLFGSRYSGLWFERKALDYFAIKVNNCFLSPSNLISFSLNDKALFEYKIGKLKVIEENYFLKDFPIFVIDIYSREKFNCSIEIAFNFRKRNESYKKRDYSFYFEDNNLIIQSDNWKIFIYGIKKVKKCYSKDHFPGNYSKTIDFGFKFEDEKENCFVIESDLGVNSRFIILISKENIAKEIYEKVKNNSIAIAKQDFVLRNYKEHNYGKSFYAGFPYFNLFWQRDLFFIEEAALLKGLYKEVKNSLLTSLKYQKRQGPLKGLLPNYVGYDEINFNSVDSTPLFLLRLINYLKFSKDFDFLKKVFNNVEDSCYFLINLDENDDYFIEFGKNFFNGFSTWMDSLDRGINAIEVDSYVAKAFKDLSEIVNKENFCKDLESYYRGTFRRIKKMFNHKENLFYDGINYDGKERCWLTANSLLVLHCNLFDVKKDKEIYYSILERIEKEDFTTPYGVRCLSSKDSNFTEEYHKGAVWSLLTGVAAIENIKVGRLEKGEFYLKILERNIWERANGIDEVIISKRPKESICQGWGEATFTIAKILLEKYKSNH